MHYGNGSIHVLIHCKILVGNQVNESRISIIDIQYIVHEMKSSFFNHITHRTTRKPQELVKYKILKHWVNSALHPSGVGKSSTSLLAGVKAGRVHLCRVAGNTV